MFRHQEPTDNNISTPRSYRSKDVDTQKIPKGKTCQLREKDKRITSRLSELTRRYRRKNLFDTWQLITGARNRMIRALNAEPNMHVGTVHLSALIG